MNARVAALTLGLALSLPVVAHAEEVRVDLGGSMVPVGPEGTSVVRVERSIVAGTRYAIVRTREPGGSSRCAYSPERVSAWSQIDGRWIESFNELFDRCPADGRPHVALVTRARVVQWSEGPASATELHVRMLDPRLPPTSAPLHRYRRVDDRFVNPRGEAPLAASVWAQSSSLPAVTGSVDGNDAEWRGVARFAEIRGSGAQRAEVWLGANGSMLRFAARVVGEGSPTLTLHLAEPGISTARLRGRAGNNGRALAVRCEGETPSVADATARCVRRDGALFIEGETNLATMLWSRDEVRAVAAYTAIAWGERRVDEGGPRLRALTIPQAFSVMEGASAEARAACATGFRGRVADSAGVGSMPGMVTCGARCENGLCERVIGSLGASSRMAWVGNPASRYGLCMRVIGAGARDFASCQGNDSDHVRLVGQLPARGFDLVVAVERTRHTDRTRQAELWTLVTRTARWQRLWMGAPESADAPRLTRVSVQAQHPVLCREGDGGGRCETIEEIAFMPEGDRGVTAALFTGGADWN